MNCRVNGPETVLIRPAEPETDGKNFMIFFEKPVGNFFLP
jgi:hypothetical protein